MPQNEDELELKVGDIIEVVGEVSNFYCVLYMCTILVCYIYTNHSDGNIL